MSSLSREHQLALEELMRREQAQENIAEYSEKVVGLVPALHHRLICDTVQDMILNDTCDDLIVNTPPGSAKSSYISHVVPAWYLGKFPKNNIIIASHSTPLAEKWSVRVRNSVASADHQLVFEDSKPDSTAASRWTTTAGGELLAAGVGTGILGFRADVAVIDDPVSGWEEAQSESQLKKIHNWFKTDLKSRLKPGAKIIQVCQRMSANDLAGYMIKQHAASPTRRLKVIKLKMEAGANDPLGRQEGERLWPEWFSSAMVLDLKGDDFIWRTMYQQEPPSDTGAWVGEEEFRYRHPVERSSRYGMTDLALSVQSGDWTVHIIVGVDSANNWDILHAERDRCAPDTSVNRVLTLGKDFETVEWLIDDDNASKVFGLFLGSVAAEGQQRLRWKPLAMRGQDKETRAAALRGQFRRGKVFFPLVEKPWMRWLKEQLLEFPNATGAGVDDGVDALGLIGRRLGSLVIPSLAPEEKKITTVQNVTLNELWAAHNSKHRRNNRI
jgi:predicted phage terminase large subunit-like protein